MKNEFSMEEKIDILIESVAKIREHLEFHDTRFDRLEKVIETLATKKQFNGLAGILERNNVISKYDAAHVRYTEPMEQ
jgi:ribosomal protein S15P/S13E